MKKLFVMLLAALLASASSAAAAQDTLPLTLDLDAGDMPPAVDLPGNLPNGDMGFGSEAIEPMADGGEAIFGEFDDGYVDPMYLSPPCPAMFESSGTWLRRGFWYAEFDFVLLNRGWDRKGLLFGYEGTPSTQQALGTGVGVSPGPTLGGGQGFGQVLTLNHLIIDGSQPGADDMMRITLGRFLFRDLSNRDHNLQATYYGGGNWLQSSTINAATNNGIEVNDFIDRVNPSFDGAVSMGFDYATQLDSFETNYLVKQRMGKDQLVLQPNGDWVRAARPSQTYSFLAGVRYLRITEDLEINAERSATVANSQGGFYDVETSNNLIGTQIGVSATHETARWSFGMTAKGGPYYNQMRLNSAFNAGTAANQVNVDFQSGPEDNLSFVGEFQVMGKWHLRPNVSLRAGMEILYVDSIALAPHQLNFISPGYTPIADDGDVFCIGSALGLEIYR